MQPTLFSPLKNRNTPNPLLGNLPAVDQIQIFKAVESTLVFRVNNIVVKWNLPAKNSHELKIHYDYTEGLTHVLPVLYGRIKEESENFNLATLFGRDFRYLSASEYTFFNALKDKINLNALKKILSDECTFLKPHDSEMFMMNPLMDGDLESFIPKLKLKGRLDLIDEIGEVVQVTEQQLRDHNIQHSDLHPRNVYYRITKNQLRIFVADFGESVKLKDTDYCKDEGKLFTQEIRRFKPARANRREDSSQMDWKTLTLRRDAGTPHKRSVSNLCAAAAASDENQENDENAAPSNTKHKSRARKLF